MELVYQILLGNDILFIRIFERYFLIIDSNSNHFSLSENNIQLFIFSPFSPK